MEVHNLFCQPIGVNFLKEDLKKLQNFSLNLKESRKISNVGGFQSKDLDYKKSPFLSLKMDFHMHFIRQTFLNFI